ncbi:hypothetical protein P7D86_15895 [Enterococcus avium]|uniref:hypothetical protein n=1 Tax=Enterococcus avium TaxID=33945 RepID=UPI00289219D8|nr:hypothetical protein [Enterococcus avium]MDT2428316.1 hypothetical protein [Enterococcus avium]
MEMIDKVSDLLYKQKVTCKEIEEIYSKFENNDGFENAMKILSESVQLDKKQIDNEMYDSDYAGNINSIEYIEKNYPKAYLFFKSSFDSRKRY